MKFVFKTLTLQDNIDTAQVLDAWGEHGYYVVGFDVEHLGDKWSSKRYHFVLQKQVEEYFEEQADE